MTLKHLAYHVDKSNVGRMPRKQQQKKNTWKTFSSSSKNRAKKEKKKHYCKAFCFTHKHRKEETLPINANKIILEEKIVCDHMKNIQNGKTLLVKQMVERAINVTTNFS